MGNVVGRLLLKAALRVVHQPGSRGGTGYATRTGRWRYGRRAPAPASPASSDLEQAREVAQRLWGTDLDLSEANGRCRIVQAGTGTARERVLADEATWPEALAAAKVAREGAATPAVAVAKARAFFRAAPPPAAAPSTPRSAAKVRFAPRPRPEGEHVLGATRSGKPVHASGAEARGYTPDDHQDAAALHHRAFQHHDARADAHQAASAGDDAWQRSELHQQEAARHTKLAAHHHDLVADHLTAGGRSGAATATLRDGALAPDAVTPHGREEQRAAKLRLTGRSHWGHPGGLTARDHHAYAGFVKKASHGPATAA